MLSYEQVARIADAATEDRGWIVNSFAQVEFLLADLTLRCRRFPEYNDLTSRLPYRLESRIRAVRGLCSTRGPLTPYAARIGVLLDRLEQAEDLRHFIVHGFSSVHIARLSDDVAIQFRRFDPDKTDTERLRELWFRPQQLHQERLDANAFAQTAVQLFADMYLTLGLEKHELWD